MPKDKTNLNIVWLCHYSLVYLKGLISIDLSSYDAHPSPWIHELASSLLKNRQVNLHIITCSDYPTHDIRYEAERFSVDIMSTHSKRRNDGIKGKAERFLARQKLYARIRKRVKEINPDIITVHGTEHISGNTVIRMKFPVVLWMQGLMRRVYAGYDTKVTRQLIGRETRLFRNLQYFITAQPHIQQEIRKENSGAMFYPLFYPVNPIAFEEVKPDGPICADICYSGSILKRKGLREFIEAMIILNKSFPDLKAMIIGSAPDKEFFTALKTRISSMGLTDRIIFTGKLEQHEEVIAKVRSSRIFVYPTHADTAPLSVAEAMAAGRAVIASSVDGIPTMLDEGRCGLMVPPRDPVALSRGIKQLLEDDDLRQHIANQAKQFARDHFYPEKISRDYLSLCRSIIEGAN